MTDLSESGKAFFTVREAADIVRVDSSTLHRAIREDAFPAVRIRTRYVVPAKALQQLIDRATETGRLVDPAAMLTDRRRARQVRQIAPEWT